MKELTGLRKDFFERMMEIATLAELAAYNIERDCDFHTFIERFKEVSSKVTDCWINVNSKDSFDR